MRIALARPRARSVFNESNPAADARTGPAVAHQSNRRARFGRRDVDRIPPTAAQLGLEPLDLVRLEHQPRPIAKLAQPAFAGPLLDLFFIASEGGLGFLHRIK